MSNIPTRTREADNETAADVNTFAITEDGEHADEETYNGTEDEIENAPIKVSLETASPEITHVDVREANGATDITLTLFDGEKWARKRMVLSGRLTIKRLAEVILEAPKW